MWFHFFQKIENHHLGRTSNAKTWNISWNIRFWWALGSVKTRFHFFVFCWAKMFSKRYRSNKDSVKIMFLWSFHILFCVFSCFLICFVTMGWFSKRWANLQTRAKLSSPQNTPNTVFKRPSKLIISVIFDDFYGFIKTFWCSIVGVFLIETHKNF